MNKEQPNNRIGKGILGLSIFTALYWIATALIKNIYATALIGAIFEMAWLPMMLLTVAIPVICILSFVTKMPVHKPYNILSLIIIAVGFLIQIVLAY